MIYNNRNKIINEKNSFFLFIKIINIFELISLSSYYLNFKEDYMIILLKNLKSN